VRRSALVLPALALGLCGLEPVAGAAAAGPTLLGVGQEGRHPTADFAAPGADLATIYVASAPDRATDGHFLEENVEHVDLLTPGEIEEGRWSDASQLDPGRYYVLLRATDADCLGAPDCLDGFSELRTLTVPAPATRFRGTVRRFRFAATVDLTLVATPLGRRLPYRVCWRRASGRRACARGTVRGFSWNEPASHTIAVRRRSLRSRTTFEWYAGGRKVASKRVRIGR
jgi:hypothetical protein